MNYIMSYHSFISAISSDINFALRRKMQLFADDRVALTPDVVRNINGVVYNSPESNFLATRLRLWFFEEEDERIGACRPSCERLLSRGRRHTVMPEISRNETAIFFRLSNKLSKRRTLRWCLIPIDSYQYLLSSSCLYKHDHVCFMFSYLPCMNLSHVWDDLSSISNFDYFQVFLAFR